MGGGWVESGVVDAWCVLEVRVLCAKTRVVHLFPHPTHPKTRIQYTRVYCTHHFSTTHPQARRTDEWTNPRDMLKLIRKSSHTHTQRLAYMENG